MGTWKPSRCWLGETRPSAFGEEWRRADTPEMRRCWDRSSRSLWIQREGKVQGKKLGSCSEAWGCIVEATAAQRTAPAVDLTLERSREIHVDNVLESWEAEGAGPGHAGLGAAEGLGSWSGAVGGSRWTNLEWTVAPDVRRASTGVYWKGHGGRSGRAGNSSASRVRCAPVWQAARLGRPW